MWHLKTIRAKNLCSFLELEYSLKRGEATLIFGNNLDSDSQNSNGSGKSALIEAISIALTGDPLRKVNIDEIINDAQEEAMVSAVLVNDVYQEQLTVSRKLSRKQPQIIQIIKQTGPHDTDCEEIVQATVADYNKYILDQLGLSKEDIYGNFILTARKYKSFLASSDKEKKEIINRFSNGALVDQSIEALQADIKPVQESFVQAEKLVSTCTGRVEALATEIEKAIDESKEKQSAKEARIKSWESQIIEKRAEIRTLKQSICVVNDSLDKLQSCDEALQRLEKNKNISISEVLVLVADALKNNKLALTTDYASEIENLQCQLIQAESEIKDISEQIKRFTEELELERLNYIKQIKSLKEKQSQNKTDKEICDSRISELTSIAKELQNKTEALRIEQIAKRRQQSEIENQLAGIIVCPSCKHEFTLSSIDIAATKEQLRKLKTTLSNIAQDIANNDSEYKEVVFEGKQLREKESTLNQESREVSRNIDEAHDLLLAAQTKVERCERHVEQANTRFVEIQDKLSRIKKRVFDEVFDVIDSAFRQREASIVSLENNIETINGSILSYEKAIEEAKNMKEENILASLKESKEQYQKELHAAIANKNEVELKLNELKAQELMFAEFKTYLANTKISAISRITNEFLETIGSDIRVALSGYTLLKSGKTRDKISVSLLRDGIDCGSFEKFSAGERVRVELASILSMNQLTNANCEEGKGLDLLIADEVLDSADEQGLASVFKALNKTQITSLVVSHGQLQEGYPNKITVTKCNGVSSINEPEHIFG